MILATSYIPASTHDIASVLKCFNLARSEPNLSSAGDSLPTLDIGSHGLSLPRQQSMAVTGGGKSKAVDTAKSVPSS